MTSLDPGVTAPLVWRRALPWGLAALMTGVSMVAIWPLRPVPHASPQIVRFTVTLPAPETIAFEELGDIPSLALSPDGSRLVYVGRRDRMSQLYVRHLDRLESRPILGTERARGPFFSPDGEWVGFFTETGLKKVPLSGGAEPQFIYASPPVPRGAAWGADETIVFAPQQATGLAVVSAVGRPPVLPGVAAPTPVVGPEGLPRLTTPDVDRGERAHLWPEILPGGKAVVFTVASGGSTDDSSIVVQSFETGARRTIIKGGSQARYVSTGHLVYARGGALLAVPFDLSRLDTTAPPMTVVDGVRLDPRTGAAQFSISSSGSLAYVPGPRTSPDRTLVWVDRSGDAEPVTATRSGYSYLTLSPDGRRLAYTLQGANQDLWVYDLDRGVQTRLTFGSTENWGAVWTPDSKRLVFSMHGPHHPNLFWMAADGSGTPERLTTGTTAHFAGAVSPDGSMLAFTAIAEKTGNDIWLLPLTGERQARLMTGTPFDEYSPTWSPDGRWLAYVSTESGRPEVFVQPYPGPGAKRQVSVDGGVAPVWGRDTREIFYRNGDRVMVVPFAAGSDFTPAPARVLFEGSFEEYGLPHWGRNYDVARGSQRFVMITGSNEPPATRICVVVNWVEELRKTLTAAR
jgi:serine/threonine-protein kinase